MSQEFTLERELGHGGHGRVWLTRSTRSGETYAVKRLLLPDAATRGRFLTEAQRWMGLPAHPHLAACRFVRNEGDELLVFSEYLPGGSLADWIRDGRLYAGEHPARTLTRIAAEAASGLAAAHAADMLHLDVKPANVLLTADGVAKLTDFGLAAGIQRAHDELTKAESVLEYVSSHNILTKTEQDALRKALHIQLAEHDVRPIGAAAAGLSVGYASPEQAEGHPVGQAADLWSWAVTVLEMFVGERTWLSGALADAVLERLATCSDAWRVRAPTEIMELLRKCFRPDPEDRPSSLDDVIDVLEEVVEGNFGFTRSTSQLPASVEPLARRERSTDAGGSWADPRDWLGSAYVLAGLDPVAALEFWPTRQNNRKAQLLDDLRALMEARRVLDQVPDSLEVRYDRARLCSDFARLQRALGDISGCATTLRESVSLLTENDRRSELLLATVLTELAAAERDLGDIDRALHTYARASSAADDLGRDPQALATQAMAAISQGNAVVRRSPAEALKLFERAAEALQGGGDNLALAKALAGKARALDLLGRTDEEELALEEAERLLVNADSVELTDTSVTLGKMALNRAIGAKTPTDRLRHGLAAIEILSPLVVDHGWTELAGPLGTALLETGRAHEHLDHPAEAMAHYQSARAMLVGVVLKDGRSDWLDRLAATFHHESALATSRGAPEAGAKVAEKAVDVLQRTHDPDDDDSTYQLAVAKFRLGTAWMNLGDAKGARGQLDGVLSLVESPCAPRTRVVVAAAHREIGHLLVRDGSPRAAIERFQQALAILGDTPDRDCLMTRVQTMESLSTAFDQVGEQESSLRALQTSAAELEPLVQEGRGLPSDLAFVRYRLANRLISYGSYAAGAEIGRMALEGYVQLINAGRFDLLPSMRQLQVACGYALLALSEVEAALEHLTAGRKAFAAASDEQSADVVQVLEQDIAELRVLLDLTDPGCQLEQERAALDRAVQLSSSGRTVPASMMTEKIVGRLGRLAVNHPTPEVLELCGAAGRRLGLCAKHAGRRAAALHGFSSATGAYGALVRGGHNEHLERWARTCGALAAMHTLLGNEKCAAEVLKVFSREVAVADPQNAPRWLRLAAASASA